MKLRRIGPNAHVLETEKGELLFSYEELVALHVKAGNKYRMRAAAVFSPTVATRAHLARFIGNSGQRWSFVADDVFSAFIRYILGAS